MSEPLALWFGLQLVAGIALGELTWSNSRKALLKEATVGIGNGLVLGLLATVFSCSAIGAVQGGLSMRLRDGLFGANLLVFCFLLFCGVNIPLDVLPGWMQAVSNVLPFTHGLQAVRAPEKPLQTHVRVAEKS